MASGNLSAADPWLIGNAQDNDDGTRFFVRNLDDSITAGYQRGASNPKTERLKKTEDLVTGNLRTFLYVINTWTRRAESPALTPFGKSRV